MLHCNIKLALRRRSSFTISREDHRIVMLRRRRTCRKRMNLCDGTVNGPIAPRDRPTEHQPPRILAVDMYGLR